MQHLAVFLVVSITLQANRSLQYLLLTMQANRLQQQLEFIIEIDK